MAFECGSSAFTLHNAKGSNLRGLERGELKHKQRPVHGRRGGQGNGLGETRTDKVWDALGRHQGKGLHRGVIGFGPALPTTDGLSHRGAASGQREGTAVEVGRR